MSAPSAPAANATDRDERPWGERPLSPRFHRMLERAQAAAVPLTVHWELTKTCNLRCVHCYFMPGAPRGDLTTAEALDALDQFAAAGTLFLNLSGGEAMARTDFFTIAEAAVEREFALRLLTNATRITRENVDRFAAIAFTCVDVSVLGDEAAHDEITTIPGSYRRAVEAIGLLRERGQAVNIKMPVMKSNMYAFDHVRGLADRFAAGFVCDVNMVCRIDGDDAPQDLMASPAELEAFLRRVNGDKPLELGSNLREDAAPCNAGISLARISHDGGVYTCVASQERIGSLRETPFAELWRSAAFARHRAVRLSDLPVCRVCEARHACIRCPGQAHSEDGDLYGPSLAACRMTKIKLDARARQEGLAVSPIVPEGLKRLAADTRSAWNSVKTLLPVIADDAASAPACGCG